MESGSKFEPPVEVYSLNETEGEDMLAACINIGMQQNNRFVILTPVDKRAFSVCVLIIP